jgi:hypothetical protein
MPPEQPVLWGEHDGSSLAKVRRGHVDLNRKRLKGKICRPYRFQIFT